MAIDWPLMTEAQAALAKAQLAPLCGYQRVGDCLEKPKRNKYWAQRTEYDGVMYDSKAEAAHAAELNANPFVKWWLRQVWVPLGPDFGTRIDFLVALYAGKVVKVVGEEVKGVETAQFRKVRKLWPKYGPFLLHIVKKGIVEVIEGKQP